VELAILGLPLLPSGRDRGDRTDDPPGELGGQLTQGVAEGGIETLRSEKNDGRGHWNARYRPAVSESMVE
jgi:hypothetical protein